MAIKAKIQAQKVIIYQAKQALQKQKAYILTQIPKNIQRYKITAPLTGTITSLPVKVGDIINTSTRIATITQNHPLEVTIKVPEKFSDKLRKGITVKVMDGQGRQLGKTEVYSIVKKDKNHKVIVVKALLKKYSI
ncbi:Probable RND efflux membrane fusion protein [Richelia intracellularis HM01]|uniref:HlyD family efflux transporter periplasmic adaptor subunit n=1 Tax=Richelia intracellularis TaxID=1164990 RepID=UPI0002B5FA62|nr:HlyD family efflux transporter periplasmic adaptor subunit [Richelia intracellularis]CCH65246.1 Probable RND efflux membrane fusion protein [Richelia intracellularis HM01]